jgi:undecaprenyl-diphosphatase
VVAPVARWWGALALGVLQGLTEFLPVSSSGHLAVAERLLAWPRPGLSLEVALHAGTLAALLAAYPGEVLRLLRGALWLAACAGRRVRGAAGDASRTWSSGSQDGARLLGQLALASAPAAAAGLLAAPWIDRLFASYAAVALGWCGTGALLVWAEGLPEGRRRVEGLRVRDLLWIGAAQALALAPGLSRSGLVAVAGLARGLAGPEAGRFAFLLALPAVAGAVALQAPHLARAGATAGPLALGALAAAVSGRLALGWCLRRVAARRLRPFGWYCLGLGGLLLLRAAVTGEWA